MSTNFVTNTATLDPLVQLFTAFPGGIEAQEARGQRELCNSAVLPSDAGNREEWAKVGVIFGDPVAGDPLFTNVTLPEGWKKEHTDHSMWSNLVDDKGRIRGRIFYKASFYDRCAHMSIASLFRKNYHESDDRSTIYGFVEANDVVVFKTAVVTQPPYERTAEWVDKHYEIKAKVVAECTAWLDANYPDYADVSAYWDIEIPAAE